MTVLSAVGCLGAAGCSSGGATGFPAQKFEAVGGNVECWLPAFTELDTGVTPHGNTPLSALNNFFAHGQIQVSGLSLPTRVSELPYPTRKWTLKSADASTAEYQSGPATVTLVKDGPDSWVVVSGSGESGNC